MAKRVMWTLRAHEDRISILDYLNTRNQSKVYSKKLNLLPKKTVTLISENPNIGRLTNVERVRAKLVKSYLIFYDERERSIYILSIWDGRRNPEQAPYK
jgi:plasmid stabilization system protein ParE